MNKIFKIVIQFKRLDQNIQKKLDKTRLEKNRFDQFWTALYIGYKFYVS